MRASCSPRSPIRPTPALSVYVTGVMPRRCAVPRVMTVFSDPVSITKSCADASLTFARTTTLSLTSRKSTVYSLLSDSGSVSNGMRCPNERRNRISARDQSAFSLWSLFGSRFT